MKIYNELESLGFFEWLKEKGFGSGFTPIILDAQPIDSVERSGYNAIAFRWFREKYKIFSCIMTEYSYGGNISTYHINGLHQSNISKGNFKTYEEAELECLIKLISIVKSNE